MEQSNEVGSRQGTKDAVRMRRCRREQEGRLRLQTSGKSEACQIFNKNKTKKSITGLTIETGMGPPAPLGYGYGETR